MTKTKNYQAFKIGSDLYFRIKALRDIPEHHVKAGDWGGQILSEENLSQEGAAWVDNTSIVRGKARIKNGMVESHSIVQDDVVVDGGRIYHSKLYGETRIKNGTEVHHSILNDTVLSGGVVDSCDLENSQFLSEAYLEDVTIKSVLGIQIHETANWTEVFLQLKRRGVIAEKSIMKRVNIDTETLSLLNDCEIEWASIENNEFFSMKKSEIPDYVYHVKGNATTGFQYSGKRLNLIDTELIGGIQLEGMFSLFNSTIHGNPIIEGNIEMEDTHISGSPTIQMVGATLKNCHISGVATLMQRNNDFSIPDIPNVVLRDDDVFIL